MTKKVLWILVPIIAIVFIGLCLSYGNIDKVEANPPSPTHTPTPTATRTPTPTKTPTPTPTDMIRCPENYTCQECQVNPRTTGDSQCWQRREHFCEDHFDCDWDRDRENWRCDDKCEVVPSITPTTESTAVPEPAKTDTTDHNSAGSFTPSTCIVEVPKLAQNPQYSRAGDAVKITWQHDGTNLTKWSLNFGYDKDNMPMGIPEIVKEAREITVNGLQYKTAWFSLCGYNGPDCQSCIWFDP